MSPLWSPRPPTPDGWSVVLPVKRFAVAKSRLAPYAGPHRPDLARAMALDTVEATLRSPAVAEVVVVTDDTNAAALALRELGAVIVVDEPGGGLNPALLHGWNVARQRRPGAPVAAMLADLPALRPIELTRALELASAHPTSFVADAPAIGTTLYTTMPGADFTPRFGGASRIAHAATGAVELVASDIPSMRRDVDTEADLREAAELGVGARTRDVLAVLHTVKG